MLTIIIGTLGTISSITGIYYFIADIHSRRRFGWKHVERLLSTMIKDIDRSKFDPDIIIGLGRGGAILAGILAGNLARVGAQASHHVPLYVIDTVMEKRGSIRTAVLRHCDPMPDVAGMNVLLVVGELYSGEDLKRGVEFLESCNVAELRTASLLTHPAASVQPDFYGIETDKPLVAPWRISAKYKESRI